MESEISKNNRFSVYLIKSEFQQLEDIVELREKPINIENVGNFVFDKSHPHPPGWVVDFFGSTINNNDLFLTSSAKGILIVPVKKNGETINFAVSFGFGRHLLKEGVIEERFGLKVVLNSLDISSFRSIDKTTLGSIPKHSREQMSKDVAAADFGIDIEQDLVSSVSGKSKDHMLGKIITGKDAFSGSAKIDVTNVVEFLSHCYERYKSSDYKTNFGWIDQISDVRDKKIENELNLLLIDKFKNRNFEKLWMAVPEIIDWSDVGGFRYLRHRGGTLYPDLDVLDLLAATGSSITLDTINLANIYMISASTGDMLNKWTVFQCIYAELKHGEEVYILNNGKWYKIEKSFTEVIQRDYENIARSNVSLPDCVVLKEEDYNSAVATALTGACCMDKKLIEHGGGHSSVEFCDIYTENKEIIHIKRYGGSSVLSHLFSQGVVSGELFIADSEFRKKLNTKLPLTHKLTDPSIRPDSQDFEIVYGIISDSDNPLDIPFFSKVSLKNARRHLTTIGYKVSLKQIKRVTISPEVTLSETENVNV